MHLEGVGVEPLVPAEVDLTDFAFMPLDVRRIRDSRFSASADGECFRAGVLLWCAAWHQVPAGSLPDDDVELAQFAGYGRVVREWRNVRDGALYGWVKCSDGRLYHPVVAEKALESWESKLEHRWRRACDRIRKHNQRFPKNKVPVPTFEQWKSCRGTAMDLESIPDDAFLGDLFSASNVAPAPCPAEFHELSTGNGGAVTRTGVPCPEDKSGLAGVCPMEVTRTSHGIPTENALKGQGQGQGQGEVNISVDNPVVDSSSVVARDRDPPPEGRVGQRDGVFRMFPEWQPSAHIGDLARTSGLSPPGDGELRASVAEFVTYWLSRSRRLRQHDWDLALIKCLKVNHARGGVHAGQRTGEVVRLSVADRQRELAIAREIGRQQAASGAGHGHALGSDDGDIRQPMDVSHG